MEETRCGVSSCSATGDDISDLSRVIYRSRWNGERVGLQDLAWSMSGRYVFRDLAPLYIYIIDLVGGRQSPRIVCLEWKGPAVSGWEREDDRSSPFRKYSED